VHRVPTKQKKLKSNFSTNYSSAGGGFFDKPQYSTVFSSSDYGVLREGTFGDLLTDAKKSVSFGEESSPSGHSRKGPQSAHSKLSAKHTAKTSPTSRRQSQASSEGARSLVGTMKEYAGAFVGAFGSSP
jgi:hypothetical protein